MKVILDKAQYLIELEVQMGCLWHFKRKNNLNFILRRDFVLVVGNLSCERIHVHFAAKRAPGWKH
jgi:hypothetical protein